MHAPFFGLSGGNIDLLLIDMHADSKVSRLVFNCKQPGLKLITDITQTYSH